MLFFTFVLLNNQITMIPQSNKMSCHSDSMSLVLGWLLSLQCCGCSRLPICSGTPTPHKARLSWWTLTKRRRAQGKGGCWGWPVPNRQSGITCVEAQLLIWIWFPQWREVQTVAHLETQDNGELLSCGYVWRAGGGVELILCQNPTALNVTLRFVCVCLCYWQPSYTVLVSKLLISICQWSPSVYIVNFLFPNQEFMEVSVTLLQISSQPSNVNNGYDSRNTNQPLVVLGNLNHGCLKSPASEQTGFSLHCSKSLIFQEN